VARRQVRIRSETAEQTAKSGSDPLL